MDINDAKKHADSPIFCDARLPDEAFTHARRVECGVLEGLTREKVKDFYSDWYNERQKDKFRFRYPGTAGEGYLDVTNRLKSVILEVESVTDHVLLISGLAVTRILLAYFRGLHRDEIVDLHVPLGALHVLEPVRGSIVANYV